MAKSVSQPASLQTKPNQPLKEKEVWDLSLWILAKSKLESESKKTESLEPNFSSFHHCHQMGSFLDEPIE